jgi:phosphatidylethanolamine-binding protein (PEBP) family uncharacterized protein
MNHHKTKKKNVRKKRGQTRYCIMRGGNKSLNVQYNSVKLNDSLEVNKQIVQKLPQIQIRLQVGKQYTLLMVDPDASWVHWILTNITSSNNYTTPLSYLPPSPPAGKHRYVFGLFEQTTGAIYPEMPYSRSGFSPLQFIRDNNLKLIAEKTIIVSA